ncbi:hypothetical protein RRG08_006866 [Elysia crispata]|uniref:Uncharacterized protein n=1 Tax=Elysia crispata TaxID=231223 RepID=A0AAE1EB54_9GAST|nr:hypothetical protein RRG08_006866 [Elysia crispata]
MDSGENSDSGKEEEDDDDDANKTELNQLMDQQKSYLQMCQTSAKILQVLAGLGGPQPTHVIELESVSNDTDVSSCSSPESMSQSPITEETTSRPESECVIWAEPLLTCQLVHPVTRPYRDVRRLPPGVTPEDVKRSKAEAAKLRAAAAREENAVAEDEKNQEKAAVTPGEQKPCMASDQAEKPETSGTTRSTHNQSISDTLTGTSVDNDKTASLVKPENGSGRGTDTQASTLPSVDAVSSSLAATREDFKRAMSQISCASETIRQAHSLLTSMGLGQYSLRRRLAQANNNNNPEAADETNKTISVHEDSNSTLEQGSSRTVKTTEAIGTRENSETNGIKTACEESACNTTEETVGPESTFPPLLLVKPIIDAEENKNTVLENQNITVAKSLMRPKEDVKNRNGSRLEMPTSKSCDAPNLSSEIPIKPVTRSNDFSDLSAPRNINVSANVRHFRDSGSNTDSWTKWSSHLQPQRLQASRHTSSVTRFTNRFGGQPKFYRNAPLLSRTQESTNLAATIQNSGTVSSVNEPEKVNSISCNNCHTDVSNLPSGPTEGGMYVSERSKVVPFGDTKGKRRSKHSNLPKHEITLAEVRKAVEFAMGTLQKSGKWTESWSENDIEIERKMDINLNGETLLKTNEEDCSTVYNEQVATDGVIDRQSATHVENIAAKRVTFSQEPMIISNSLKDVRESVSQDKAFDVENNFACGDKQDSCSHPTVKLGGFSQVTQDTNKMLDAIYCLENDNLDDNNDEDQDLHCKNNYQASSINASNETKVLTSRKTSPLPQCLGREDQVDTQENKFDQRKQTYFDRLKEICNKQTLKKAETDVGNIESCAGIEHNNLIALRECGETQTPSKHFENITPPEITADEDTKAAPLLSSSKMDLESDGTTEQNICKDTNISETKWDERQDAGVRIFDVGENDSSINGSLQKSIFDRNCDSQRNTCNVHTSSAESNRNKKETCNDLGVKEEKDLGFSEGTGLEHEHTTKGSDRNLQPELYDSSSGSVLLTDSSAAVHATFTCSSSTIDHVLVLMEDEEGVASGQQKVKTDISTETFVKTNHGTDDRKGTMQNGEIGDGDVCNLEEESDTIVLNSSAGCLYNNAINSGCHDDVDESITYSREEPLYKPSFYKSPSSIGQDDSPTLSSSIEKLRVTMTRESSSNLHRSLSAGDTRQSSEFEKTVPFIYYSTGFKSAPPHDASIPIDSASGSSPKIFRGINPDKKVCMKSPRLRSSSEDVTAAKVQHDQIGDDLNRITASNTRVNWARFDHKPSRSCGNSPRNTRPSSALKWRKFAKTAAPPLEVSPAQSTSVSIIEMMEEKKPEPIIFSDPSLSMDPFGIKESNKVRASDDIDRGCSDHQTETKLADGHKARDSDEDSEYVNEEDFAKGATSLLFSRTRRLRFRRRRRRRRQRSGSWWTRSVRCVRSKLRSLFGVCCK